MSEARHLWIGGLVAVGFDASGKYLLAISHSGRGVFSTITWDRLARDSELAYPINGQGVGIGPINGQSIRIVELDSDHDISITSPDGAFELVCTTSEITITNKR